MREKSHTPSGSVPAVPTVWLTRGTKVDLAALLRAQGWEAAVLKPAVSASSHETRLIRLLELETTEPGLVLTAHPPAGDHLADAIVRRLDGEL